MQLTFNIFFASLFGAQAIQRPETRWGRKVLCFCILILLAVPFQLSGPLLQAGWAAERLPVVLLQDMKGKPAFEALLNSIQAAGFTPRTIREEDFSFNISAKTSHTVVVPVGSDVTPEALNQLSQYIAKGGRVILIPSGETPNQSVGRLFALVGLPLGELIHAPQAMRFNWKGLAFSSGEALPQASQLLLIQPNMQMDILATWGSDVPAIASTGKGAVLNWQWGRQLSRLANTIALSKVIYPGKTDPVIMLQQDENKTTASDSLKPPLAPEVKPNPALNVRPALIAMPKPAVEPKIPPGQEAAAFAHAPAPAVSLDKFPAFASPDKAPPPVKMVERPSEKPTSGANAAMLTAPNQAKAAGPQTPEANRSPQVASHGMPKLNSSHPNAKAADSAENEVLNNILGIPANESLQTGTTTQPTGAVGGTTGPQKRFSFLDADAASVLAPEFDYGVYSMNLRKLDDYKRRVRDALEAGRQLSLDLPEEKVNALLKEAEQHKKKFEALYLAGQTQAGLDENTLAHHAALQALALTTTSPQVEGRAIWLDRGSIIACGGPEGLKKRMQKLHQAGINIVYFETINAGFPIYPSKLVRRNPLVNGWDPLKVAVDEGHRQGMEVHAWVWAFAVGNRRHNAVINQPDDYAGPILTEGGMMGEALRNHDGGLSVDSHQHEFWLSPASPKARDFLLNLYKEVVTHYDVDGLQLDYIRYPFQTSGNRMGYEAIGRERFAQSTGQSLDSSDEYSSRVWTAWKTYQVSSFVQQVSTTLKKLKPELKLSAAVFPMRREARIAAIQQDWETWIDNGWIDTLSPMSYTSDPARLQEMFEYVQNSPHKHPMVYPGIALHRLDGGQLVQHLEALRQKGGLGTTFFAGTYLDDDKANTLAAGPYKQADSLAPHHDVVKSLQAIVADYGSKLAILRQKGVLKEMSAQQLDGLQAALQHLADALVAVGSGRPFSGISLPKLQAAQRCLSELQAQSQSWSKADKLSHPYRAEYFERDLLLLTEIMGYTTDKLGLSPMAAFVPPSAKTAVAGNAIPLSPAVPMANLKQDVGSTP
jgi:uncharacterized lipoprotein YddW (UPF0748 family)